MTQHRSVDTKMATMKEAVAVGRPDIAVDILSDHPSVRAYIRSPNSKPGVQVDWTKPFPEGTKYIVYVDTYGGPGKTKPPVFYIIPAKAYKAIVRKVSGVDKNGVLPRPRPVNPDSHHCCKPLTSATVRRLSMSQN
jgi:hypothetical protein